MKQENNNNAKGQNRFKRHTGVQQTCYHCGEKHSALDCRFINEKCHTISKTDHIACACRKEKVTSQYVYIQYDEAELFGMYAVHSTSGCEKVYTVNVALGTTILLDTGSAVSVVSDEYFQTSVTHFPLKSAFSLKLKSYSSQRIAV